MLGKVPRRAQRPVWPKTTTFPRFVRDDTLCYSTIPRNQQESNCLPTAPEILFHILVITIRVACKDNQRGIGFSRFSSLPHHVTGMCRIMIGYVSHQ